MTLNYFLRDLENYERSDRTYMDLEVSALLVLLKGCGAQSSTLTCFQMRTWPVMREIISIL